jgi:hypothetical protein
MSGENLEITRAFHVAWNAADMDAIPPGDCMWSERKSITG